MIDWKDIAEVQESNGVLIVGFYDVLGLSPQQVCEHDFVVWLENEKYIGEHYCDDFSKGEHGEKVVDVTFEDIKESDDFNQLVAKFLNLNKSVSESRAA